MLLLLRLLDPVLLKHVRILEACCWLPSCGIVAFPFDVVQHNWLFSVDRLVVRFWIRETMRQNLLDRENLRIFRIGA